MAKAKNGYWILQAKAQELAKQLMDYDNCHDGHVDAAAKLLMELSGAIETLVKQRDDLIREKHAGARGKE